MAEEPDLDARRRRFETEAVPHLDALYRSAKHWCRNGSDAEDLVQETMVRAWRFFDRYEPGTNCKAWLFRILTNTRINAHHRAGRRPAEADSDAIESLAAPAPGEILDAPSRGEIAVFAHLLDDEMKAALESLPEPFRIVLVLAVVEGFSYKEIAAMLEVPIGTVMSRLFRARRLLQAALRPYARQHGWEPQ